MAGIELANWNWRVVHQFVLERFGIGLSRSGCLNYLHRLGFAFKRPRGCRQNNLVQIASARIWQIARKDASFLAYRVAMARHCLKSRNEFSTK